MALLVTLLAGAPARAEQITYTYDALGQLTSAQLNTTPTVTYSYDDAGNRIALDVATGEELMGGGESGAAAAEAAAPEEASTEGASQEAAGGAAD